jgi:hypothetical protein
MIDDTISPRIARCGHASQLSRRPWGHLEARGVDGKGVLEEGRVPPWVAWGPGGTAAYSSVWAPRTFVRLVGEQATREQRGDASRAEPLGCMMMHDDGAPAGA